jgi:EpsI family protein
VGNGKEKQLISLIGLLLLTAILVYWSTNTVKVTKSVSLQAVLGPVKGYNVLQASPLDDHVISFLELDDYTQTRYEKDGRAIDLYIGYYFSLDKISAAHSPLVCFPGQGWAVSQPAEYRLTVNKNEIHYAEIIASMQERQELVMYWYQAHEKTVPEAYKNKLNALLNKLSGKKQEHAFIRISVPIGESGPEQARNIGKDFIAAFYPVFLTYVNSTP